MKREKETSGEMPGAASDAVIGKKMKKRRAVIIVVIVAVVVVVAILFAVRIIGGRVEVAEMENNAIWIQPVETRDLSETITLKGTVSGASQTNVTSTAVSQVTAVNVQLGDAVEEGDVLCTLDSASIEEQIADLEKTIAYEDRVNEINTQSLQDALEQAKKDQVTQLTDAEDAIDEAKARYDQASQQWDNGEIEFITLYEAKKAVESAEKSYDSILESTNKAIESAEQSVELDAYQQDSTSSSKDALAELKGQLGDCEVTAPCSGIVTAVNVKVGDVNAGSAVTLFTIEDTSSFLMVASVSESDILKLEEGMTAVVTSTALGDAEIAGEVTRVVRVKSSSDAYSSSGYSVELAIDTDQLLIGMEAKAKVTLADRSGVLTVPYDLVRYGDYGEPYVLVAANNGDGTATAVAKYIEIGDDSDYYIEVAGGDLAEGDMLVYDYSLELSEGDVFWPAQEYDDQYFYDDYSDDGGSSDAEFYY